MRARINDCKIPALAWAPGLAELLIILVIVLVLFGAGKLPQVGRSLGDAISEFKDGVKPKAEDEEASSTATEKEEKAE